MPAVSTYSPTGNPYVDGLLMGTKWAGASFTYSFPTRASYYGSTYGNGEPANAFKALNTTQQSAVQKDLAIYASVANLTFKAITETSSQHADLRYAESNSPSTAWAYYPTTAAEGGDAWFNNTGHYYDRPVKGNYAWITFLHETGHALGLKHPHEVSGSFNSLPSDHDSVEYTVMSYRSYVGGSTTTGYVNGDSDYPQSLMMDDIAALQALYGAKFDNVKQNLVYKWDALTGQEFINGVGQGAPGANKVFMTVWTGGAHATYDFSNYATDLKVDLQPGHWSTTSIAQLAHLDTYGANTHLAAGNIANALFASSGTANDLISDAIGGKGKDTIIGNDADNRITGGAGNDYLDGLAGRNTAVYSGKAAEHQWFANADGTWTVKDLRSGTPDGIDTLAHIQVLHFDDGDFNFDGTDFKIGASVPIAAAAPTVTSPVASTGVSGTGAAAVGHAGAETPDLMPLSAKLMGTDHFAFAQSDADYVQHLYRDLLGRDGDSAGQPSWTHALENGEDRADVVKAFLGSPEYHAHASSMNTSQYVEALYEGILGRHGDDGGAHYWSDALDSHSLAREDVEHALLYSSEYQNKYVTPSNTSFVQELYQHALGREADDNGLHSWVDKLEHGMARADVALGIAESPEAHHHIAYAVEHDWHLP